nr:WhiB family transcriptional regulator [Rhodococcus sp. ACPA1]
MRAFRTVSQSHLPTRESLNGRLAALCRVVEPSLFFHPSNERGPRRATRIARAKQICSGCPVPRPCREYALSAREPFGIWGGTSEEDRDRILGRKTANRSA